MQGVRIKEYAAPPVCFTEILRYAGVRGEAPEVSEKIQALLNEVLPLLSYRVCYCVLDVRREGELIDLGFIRLQSRTLQRALAGCDNALLMVATVGHALDRLITRLSLTSPVSAHLADAIGTERVEALCDAFCADVAGGSVGAFVPRLRISPGYGDLPITLQREIFATLTPTAKIGVGLTQGLQMAPSKSVSALLGLQKR